MPHLVSAFSAFCDVRTIGPVLRGEDRVEGLAEWPPRGHVDVDLRHLGSLFDVLPANWVPDLVLSVSGGGVSMFTNTHDLPCPTVFYSVDTWQCYLDYLEALHYDVVFAGQCAYIPLLRAAGSRHVHWLPMACNPADHKPTALHHDYDVVFVGGTTEPVHWQRAPLLRAMQARYTVQACERVYGDAMVRAYGAGRIAFNHSAVQDVNMRVFEALAMGCALLTNRDAAANGLTDLFKDGKHLLIYDDESDLLQKCAQLIADSSLRDGLGVEGRSEVLARHTYAHRAAAIVDAVRSLAPDFPTADQERMPRGGGLVDYLPFAPGAVLDFGMGLGISRYAIAKYGVTKFVGYSDNADLRRQRAGSFDAVCATMDPSCAETFDTVAIERTFASEQALCHAWMCLVQGGTLLLNCNSPQLTNGEELETWLRERDFHLVQRYEPTEETTIAVARKRTRRLRDIAREVCDRLGVPGVDGEAVAALLGPDW